MVIIDTDSNLEMLSGIQIIIIIIVTNFTYCVISPVVKGAFNDIMTIFYFTLLSVISLDVAKFETYPVFNIVFPSPFLTTSP